MKGTSLAHNSRDMEARKPTAVPERNRVEPDRTPQAATAGIHDETRMPAPGHDRASGRRYNAAWQSKDVLRAAAIVLGLWIALRLLWFAQAIVLTAFLGVLFGLAVTAGVDWLARRRVPRGIGAAVVTFGTIALVVGFFAWAAPTLRGQSRELQNKLPEAVDKLDTWLEAHRDGVIGFFLSDQQRSAPPDSAVGRDSASATAPQTHPPSSTLRSKLLNQVAGAQRYFFGFISSTLTVFAGLVLVIFLAIYVAAEPDTYHDGLMHLFPHRSRKRAGEVLTAMAAALRKWLVTQLLAMIAIGVITTIVLLSLGVRAAFPLGVIAGLLEFIPTIGPILSALPAVAMGFVDSPEKALWVALAYIGIQFVENHLLVPLLMKGGVDLPPVLTILAQALMALGFGFLGLLVAVPMLAAVMVAVKMLYVEAVVGDPVTVPETGDPDS
jgi:predicted PurR-regulated permease PerM